MVEEEKGAKGNSLPLEERLAWEHAMQGVRKLKRNKSIIPKNTTAKPPMARVADRAVLRSNVIGTPTQDHPVNLVLERRQAKRLRQGKIVIDAKIDLHGFTEVKAYDHLLHKVGTAYQQGKHCLLVVTGKGRDGKGLLAQRVPHWLNNPELRGKIIRIAEALPQHGGSGALYIFLKKRPLE